MEQILLFLGPLFEAYAGKYGAAVQAFSILGSLRFFIKPLMGLLEAYVAFTPSKADDLLPEQIKNNKVYKAIVYALDWFASLKFKK
jgi:hypothetical protein